MFLFGIMGVSNFYTVLHDFLVSLAYICLWKINDIVNEVWNFDQ